MKLMNKNAIGQQAQTTVLWGGKKREFAIFIKAFRQNYPSLLLYYVGFVLLVVVPAMGQSIFDRWAELVTLRHYLSTCRN